MKKPIRLVYEGKRTNIINAVNKANEILNEPTFYNKIKAVKKFDQTNILPAEIADLLGTSDYDIWVVAKIMPIANAKTLTHNEIKVSKSNFSSDLAEAVNTLIHEAVHAVDWLNGQQDFTHNDNDNSDHKQDNTAPWVIGAIAESMV